MKRTLLRIALGIVFTTGAISTQAQDPQQIADGAKVWADNCTRCHNGRSSMERNDREWTTIVLHMRARANLTRTEASKVITYMHATNAPEAGTMATSSATDSAGSDRVGSEPRQPRQSVTIRMIPKVDVISSTQLLAIHHALRSIE